MPSGKGPPAGEESDGDSAEERVCRICFEEGDENEAYFMDDDQDEDEGPEDEGSSGESLPIEDLQTAFLAGWRAKRKTLGARNAAAAKFESWLRSPKGTPRDLARIGRGKEGGRLGARNSAAAMFASSFVVGDG